MVRRESRPSTISHITLGTKQTGAPSAGNLHAGCDVAGAGNGFTVWLLRHSQRKRGATARLDLRNTAPVLDPTGYCLLMRLRGGISTVAHVLAHPLRSRLPDFFPLLPLEPRQLSAVARHKKADIQSRMPAAVSRRTSFTVIVDRIEAGDLPDDPDAQ